MAEDEAGRQVRCNDREDVMVTNRARRGPGRVDSSPPVPTRQTGQLSKTPIVRSFDREKGVRTLLLPRAPRHGADWESKRQRPLHHAVKAWVLLVARCFD